MPDYFFYFANSPAGGGLVRLKHYLASLSTPKCLYAIDARAKDHFDLKDPRLLVVDRPRLARLFDEDGAVRGMDLRQTVVFSHGAPIQPACKNLVLHINNVLPFLTGRVRLDWKLRLKMDLLRRRLHKTALAAHVVTVESQATQELIGEVWGRELAQKCRILSNGVDAVRLEDLPPVNVKGPYVLTIGTYPYKRIDLVLKEFERLRQHTPSLKLVMIGTIERHATGRSGDEDRIVRLPQTSYAQTRALIANCDTYLTMSEAENCSIALLEAIYHRRPIYASPIASHREFLSKHGYKLTQQKSGVLQGLPPRAEDDPIPVPTWAQIAKETMAILGED